MRLAATLVVCLIASLARAEGNAQRPRLDVAFVLDTTGSMGDEIDVVKEKLVGIAKRLGAGQPTPDVRFAVVAFRDQGDEYVTKTLPFTRDVAKTHAFIRGLGADGGGDSPEDIAAALHATLKLEWDAGANVARVAFLVGDAGPQSYERKPDWKSAATNLAERKIALNTIGCSGLEADARRVFEALAERTRGDFEQLTYRRVERHADGKKRTILTSGGETFVAEGEISESEWKKGAAVLAAEGRVKRDESYAAAPAEGMATKALSALLPAAPVAGSGGLAPARARRTASETVTVTGDMTNNLDEEISQKLLRAATAAGSKF